MKFMPDRKRIKSVVARHRNSAVGSIIAGSLNLTARRPRLLTALLPELIKQSRLWYERWMDTITIGGRGGRGSHEGRADGRWA